MKCIKCQTENVNKANYCKNCGNHFTKKEQESAKKWSFVWFLEKIDKIKSIFDFSIVTDHIAFKIASILVILGIGLYSFFSNGINLRLLESDQYKIQYNTKLSEYYLLVAKEKTNLNLYIPNRATKIMIKHMTSDDQVLEEREYKQGDAIILDSNGKEDYYTIEARYEKDNLDRMKLYIYLEEVTEVN